VVQQSRTNLTKGKKNASKRLYDSIEYQVNVGANDLSVIFSMEDYGKFQDLGVSGVKKKYNTPYSYKDKMPPAKAFSDWVVRKGLKGIRDEKGRFIKRKSLQYIIARSVYTKGIKPSLFFTKPFERAFERLPQELQEKFGIDLQNAFD
jgi:hypothetical protein